MHGLRAGWEFLAVNENPWAFVALCIKSELAFGIVVLLDAVGDVVGLPDIGFAGRLGSKNIDVIRHDDLYESIPTFAPEATITNLLRGQDSNPPSANRRPVMRRRRINSHPRECRAYMKGRIG